MSYQEVSRPEAKAKAKAKAKAQQRHRKYTPERIQQIKDLVARGETCDQIAATIGVTVGSLKVTCSRLGMSLRRPRVKLPPPKTGSARTLGAARETATFILDIKYNGQEHSIEMPFTPAVIRQLALEASFRNQEIGELTKEILVSVFEKGIVPNLLDK